MKHINHTIYMASTTFTAIAVERTTSVRSARSPSNATRRQRHGCKRRPPYLRPAPPPSAQARRRTWPALTMRPAHAARPGRRYMINASVCTTPPPALPGRPAWRDPFKQKEMHAQIVYAYDRLEIMAADHQHRLGNRTADHPVSRVGKKPDPRRAPDQRAPGRGSGVRRGRPFPGPGGQGRHAGSGGETGRAGRAEDAALPRAATITSSSSTPSSAAAPVMSATCSRNPASPSHWPRSLMSKASRPGAG